jgi:hypothetical protein
MMEITKEELRQIVREECERIAIIYLDAKGHDAALANHALFVVKTPLSPSYKKSSHPSRFALKAEALTQRDV